MLLVTLVELVLVLVLATAMITNLLLVTLEGLVLVLVLATAMITYLLFMVGKVELVGAGSHRDDSWCCTARL